MAVSVILSNPLSASTAVQLGLSSRRYAVGETVSVSTAAGKSLVGGGYGVYADGGDPGGGDPGSSSGTFMVTGTPADGDLIGYVGSGWAVRTLAQIKTALALGLSDITGLVAALGAKLGVLEAVNVVAASGASLTLSGAATMHDVTLTANCTLTLPTAAPGASLTVVLRQDSTGGRGVTWSGVKWDGGAPPSLSTAASAIDVVTFLSTQTQWFGFLGGRGMA